MPKIKYTNVNFAAKTLTLIRECVIILNEYAAQKYDLTLRQLYYQLVSRDIIPNKQTEYKRLGGIVSDARRAGIIDWNAIVDRGRNLRGNSHWDDPASIIEGAAYSYRTDLWARQSCRLEVWIEKEALAGVFERACRDLDIPFFACKGYPSDSETWAAGRRLAGYGAAGQHPVILHFGDHDPSGIDMTRDIADRLKMFAGRPVEVRRLALNMNQVEEYSPPPNPAKETDCRFAGYCEKFGDESWELDALTPTVLGDILRNEVAVWRDQALWDAAVAEMSVGKDTLMGISKSYDKVAAALEMDVLDAITPEAAGSIIGTLDPEGVDIDEAMLLAQLLERYGQAVN